LTPKEGEAGLQETVDSADPLALALLGETVPSGSWPGS